MRGSYWKVRKSGNVRRRTDVEKKDTNTDTATKTGPEIETEKEESEVITGRDITVIIIIRVFIHIVKNTLGGGGRGFLEKTAYSRLETSPDFTFWILRDGSFHSRLRLSDHASLAHKLELFHA